jgi:hypothetical protein
MAFSCLGFSLDFSMLSPLHTHTHTHSGPAACIDDFSAKYAEFLKARYVEVTSDAVTAAKATGAVLSGPRPGVDPGRLSQFITKLSF